MTDCEIASRLGLTVSAVARRRLRLGRGVRFAHRRPWTPQEDALLGTASDTEDCRQARPENRSRLLAPPETRHLRISIGSNAAGDSASSRQHKIERHESSMCIVMAIVAVTSLFQGPGQSHDHCRRRSRRKRTCVKRKGGKSQNAWRLAERLLGEPLQGNGLLRVQPWLA